MSTSFYQATHGTAALHAIPTEFAPDIKYDIERIENAQSEFLNKPLEELTVSQTAKILGINDNKVIELITDRTLCCARTVENSAPLVSAACVQAQMGKTQPGFLAKVREIIAAQNSNKTASSKKLGNSIPEPGDIGINDLFFEGTALAEQAKLNDGDGNSQLNGEEKPKISGQSIKSLLASLDFANVRLESAMHRIGYLEAQVDNLQEQLKPLPELREKSLRLLMLQHEAKDLSKSLSQKEDQLAAVHQIMARIQNNYLLRVFCCIFGINLG